MSERTIVVDVETEPGAGDTPEARGWRAAVAEAVAAVVGEREVDADTRYQVEVYFRLPERGDAPAGHLNALVATTIDALGAAIGRCPERGHPYADDARVDRLVAGKRTARDGETLGARIRVTEMPRVTGRPA
ncbi:hypothetical protein [Pseudonocardia sp. N23]|uniref:hypothetical protein n=1 Tax=Pseudonocardia sp. N23 TaxID=1987376 RepID=UPI000BFB13D1|nr:hypothetical protein [Pseudonocardia sp. N23]GAY12363.1 hypothetical protein TOK_0758 [Pseudonocardia sp. N23]